MLRRLCIKFSWVKDEDLLELKFLEKYHTLIIPHAVSLPPQSHHNLHHWIRKGGYLLVTGQTDLPNELLGLSEKRWHQPKGYSAIQYGRYNIIAGYPGYTIGICTLAYGTETIGSAYEILNPKEEISCRVTYTLGPGIIRYGKVIYIPIPLFETFGAILQGHVDIEEIRDGGHRYKYLDWIGRFIKDLFEESGWNHLWRVRVKPWGEYRGVVVLRHDTDESSDMTYLDFERKEGIPATFAILDDRHRREWLMRVKAHPKAEASFHFDTGPGKYVRFGFKKKISGKRLWREVVRAQEKLHIPIESAQRHNSFFYYPEIVDAMDYLYEKEKEVIGLGTMFRFTNFMFGGAGKKGGITSVIQHPDTSVPFWFPYRLWYASAKTHRALRGWDITQVIEPEPWLTEHLLNQEEYLEDGVYTLGFHPAHCHGKSFRPDGNWNWFRFAVELGRSRKYLFATCKEVFQRINQWEDLIFTKTRDGLRTHTLKRIWLFI